MTVLQSSINERTFNQEVLASSVPVLVHFWAPWCGLCRFIQPLLVNFQAQHPEQLKLVGINADENLRLASTYQLRTLPTLLLFSQGQILYRLDHFRSYDELKLALEQIILRPVHLV